MASFHLTLDPPAVAVDRVELDLNSGPILTGGTSPGNTPDWGEAAISQWLADLTWGSAPVDYRVPNRMVKIPLFLGAGAFDSEPDAMLAEETARALLQQKVALLQREGGWLLRQRDGGPPMYADVVNASLTLPDVWGETGGIEPDVVLTLECLPDFYGDEITLDTVAATGVCTTVVAASGTAAVIEGDYPARCRIDLTSASGARGLLWALRSRHYDSAATAALFYEAEALTPLDAAATHVHVGASGGSTLRHNSLPGGSWCPVMLTDLLSGSGLTHQGSYRVWARVYSATAVPQLRLLWGVGDVAHPVTNDPAQPLLAANWFLVDLGQVRLDPPPSGNYRWHGVIQALAATQGDPIEIDCVYLQPLDESAGALTAVQSPSPSLAIESQRAAGAGADDGSIGTAAWINPGLITAEDGDDARAVAGSGATSHYLKSSAHGFAVPTGATISGIEVEIKRWAPTDIEDGTTVVADNQVRLIRAGTIETHDKADVETPWPSVRTFKRYGGQSDLWGAAWTPADLNDAGFGVALSAKTFGPSSPQPQHVDFIRVTVFYTTAGGFTAVDDAVVYAHHSVELRSDGMFRQDSTGAVEGPVAVSTGDLPRVPPSGLEGRAVELFLRPSPGTIGQGIENSDDNGSLTGLTAQIIYRPCWLSRP